MRRSKEEAATVRLSADNLYAAGQEIWSTDDRWNQYKRKRIEHFVLNTSDWSGGAPEVLDAGSGNSLYDWMPTNRVSTDRFFRQIKDKHNAVVCDLEILPFKDGCFDLVFCI
jgi:hypothetical protein